MTSLDGGRVKMTASIVSSETGKVIGGPISRRHDDGDVTILFAGLSRRGSPLTLDDLLSLEAQSCA